MITCSNKDLQSPETMLSKLVIFFTFRESGFLTGCKLYIRHFLFEASSPISPNYSYQYHGEKTIDVCRLQQLRIKMLNF